MPISVIRNEVIGYEPITLDEMKRHLRVDFPDDDDLISSLITAARERAETVTGRTFVVSNWTYYLDSFPYNWYKQHAPARADITSVMTWWADAQCVRLPKNPVQEVISVEYQSGNNGVYTTLSPSAYTVDYASEPCVLYPINNLTWPSVYAVHNCVKITFTAGYPEVPETIKTAIKMLVTFWYENRGDDQSKTPQVTDMLLRFYKSQPVGYVR